MTSPSPTRTAEHARFLAPGEGEAIWFLRNRMTVKATADHTGGAYGLVESLIAPGILAAAPRPPLRG